MKIRKFFSLSAFFNWSSFIGTIAVFLFMWGLGSIGLQFEFLNVFESVVKDYNLTDVYYTNFRKPEEVPFEEDIILVNIGVLDRLGIADEINIINQFKPKVIGIDARFFTDKDPMIDNALREAVSRVDNFVFASEFQGGNEQSLRWDTLMLPRPQLMEGTTASTGFVNVPYEGSGDFVTWRKIPPVDRDVSNKSEMCFAGKVAELYDKEAADHFFSRGNELEDIFFKGNLDKYLKIDIDDIEMMATDSTFDGSFIEGKIILMGYLGAGYTDYHFDEDRFYTPLNPNSIGRGYPDMYGVVVHANIVSMILNKTYINQMPDYLSYIIAVLVCYFNALIFTRILKDRKTAPLYGLTKLLQLLEIIIVVGIVLWVFTKYRYQLNLTLTVLAILLSGDLIEIYVDIIETGIKKMLRKI